MEIRILRNRAAFAWLIQVVTGILLVVLLFVHLIANHFIVPGGLQTYQDVVSYLSNPLILVLELAFLVIVTIHALLGVRAILLDRGPSAAAASRMDRTLWIIGTTTVVYGVIISVLIVT